MWSKLALGGLFFTAVIDVVHSSYACMNNAALDSTKSINTPEGIQSCGGDMVKLYTGALDTAYAQALSRGLKGTQICAQNVTVPGEDGIPIAGIINVAKGCCASPNNICNPNQMCGNPNSFNPDATAVLGNESTSCTEIGSMLVGKGNNCDAPIDGATDVKVGHIIKSAGFACCGGTGATACGTIAQFCSNPQDFRPNANASLGFDTTRCTDVAAHFSSVGGNCNAIMKENNSEYVISALVQSAGLDCCAGGGLTTCGKLPEICDNPQDFRPNLGVFNDSAGVTTCELVRQSYAAKGARCSAGIGDGVGTNFGTFLKVAATNGCCGSGRRSVCGVGLTACANPSNFQASADALEIMGEMVRCSDVVAMFMSMGSNCSAMSPVPGANATFSGLFQQLAGKCCGSQTQTVCDAPFPTLPPSPASTSNPAPYSTSNVMRSSVSAMRSSVSAMQSSVSAMRSSVSAMQSSTTAVPNATSTTTAFSGSNSVVSSMGLLFMMLVFALATYV